MGYTLDAYQEFEKDRTTNANGTRTTKVLDNGNDRNIGVGEPLALFLKVLETKAGGTYTFDLETSSVADFSSDVVSLGTISVKADIANTAYVHYIPKDFRAARYMRLKETVAGGGEITYDAHVLPANMIDAWTSYPAGYTIQRS